MRFEQEVYDQYLTYSSVGNRVAAKLSLFGKRQFLPELWTLLGSSKMPETESLGVIDIPVNKIVGVASICGNYSYTVNFLPIDPPSSRFAKTWCSIYLNYLNEREIAPITCYEYLGQFYVVDGKIRVSVMKCNGAPVISANVIRVLPSDKNSPQSIQYYSFLESYKKPASIRSHCAPNIPSKICRRPWAMTKIINGQIRTATLCCSHSALLSMD